MHPPGSPARPRPPALRALGAAAILSLAPSPALPGSDWPAYRHDAHRSGYTAAKLPATLALDWVHQAAQPPQPAWPRSARLTYDRAFQPVIAAGVVCFGSSADNTVRALDAATGAERWQVFTEAPVRFAPAFAHGRFYVAGDDGRLYAFTAETGATQWAHHAAPNDEFILGNGRMISRWPLRGGPVVLDQTVYFTCGLWPSDGVTVVALDASASTPRWVNDTAGHLYLGQPHGGAYAHSGISPQGYLAATDHQLFVPNGRAIPAAFQRSTGAFDYFHLQANGQHGNSKLLVADQFFLNDGLLFNQRSGELAAKLGPGEFVALPEGLLRATDEALFLYRWADEETVDRRGEKQTARRPQEAGRIQREGGKPVAEAVVAGNYALLGHPGLVSMVDLQTSNLLWQAEVAGTAHGLAVANGRLYVSTDQGRIYCFSASAGLPPRAVRPETTADPLPPNEPARRAAAEILQLTGIRSGYCLDLACGDGALACELAQQSRLHIVAVEADAQQVAVARARLAQAGLYGSRVTVLHRNPSASGLPDYFANLVVSGRSLTEGEGALPADEAFRQQRPHGGSQCVGKPGAMRVSVRGPLPGAGSWTHQYADPANTLCSEDERVTGPLGMLWFTDVDQRLVQRHGRPPAPLFNRGILYSEGIDSLIAVDAYNGHLLWEYPLPGILAAYDGDHLMGTSGTGSNFCLSDDSVYLRSGAECLRIDALTGQLLGRFAAPQTASGQPARWGFIAYADGLLFGSLANPEHVVTYRYLKGGDLTRQLTESDTLFALDALTGELRWRYDAQHSLRHNAIAIGSGTVTLIDRPLAFSDRTRGAPATNHVTGTLVALAARSGEVLWRNNEHIFGTVLLLSTRHNRILMTYQPTRFQLASELGGRLACFDLSTGQQLWQRPAAYSSRPLINDATVYAEGGAWDLLTGEDRPFKFQRSYGCGILAGAKNLLVFRSATLGYFDLTCDQGTEEFGGMRPGCWINALPAGGLVFVPDATAGCVCSYQNQAWIALQPDGLRPPAIHPARRTSRQPVTVQLQRDGANPASIHYTVDGTPPRQTSPRYQQPFTLHQSTTLNARTFSDNGRASRPVTARFIVDPTALSVEPADWQVWDAPNATPPSDWLLTEDAWTQRANTLVNRGQAMSRDPAAERPGTLQIYQPGATFKNGVLHLELRSTDNDTVGVAFRLRDPAHHYLYLMDSERSFRALTVKEGEHYQLLSSSARGYTPGTWHAIRISLQGPHLTIHVDGQMELEATDARFPSGTVALYSWGNSGVSFRNLRFMDPEFVPSNKTDPE